MNTADLNVSDRAAHRVGQSKIAERSEFHLNEGSVVHHSKIGSRCLRWVTLGPAGGVARGPQLPQLRKHGGDAGPIQPWAPTRIAADS
jgi:hypothetical protein